MYEFAIVFSCVLKQIWIWLIWTKEFNVNQYPIRNPYLKLSRQFFRKKYYLILLFYKAIVQSVAKYR